jgi:acetyl esterase/lipase
MSPRLLPLLLAGWITTISAVFAAPPPPCTTYTYKKVGPLEIKADVYRPSGDVKRRPVVVYMHGGSLINGKRQSIENHPMLPGFLDAGFIVVSIDYRLAPETKLPALVEDIEDAFRWVREKGPELFGADPDRIASAGGSAGGYLALLTGCRIQPRPRVIYAEMSYCDLIGDWQLRASIHPPHYHDSNLNELEAWRQVSGPPIANSGDRQGDGSAFNDFIRRCAQWPKAISGWDPRTEADKYLPYLPLRHVTPDYPPTFMLHGEADTDVPVSQPRAMAAELQRNGVEHRLVTLPGTEHGFRGGDPAVTLAGEKEGIAFVITHLQAASAGQATSRP